MLSRDVKSIDLDPRHWVNLISLFERERAKKTFLLVFVEHEICVKALHSARGPLPGFQFTGVEHLEKIRRENGADFLAVIPADLLGRVFAAWQQRISHADDWDRQILTIASTVKSFVRKEVTWHPAPPFLLPDDLSMDRIEKLAGRFWPDETCLGFFVFEGNRPYTSLILGKQAAKITLVTTLDTFGLGEGSFDWRTQWQAVAKLCKERFMPMHAALWIDLACLREMTAGPRALSFLHLSQRRGRALFAPRPLFWRVSLFLARHFGGR